MERIAAVAGLREVLAASGFIDTVLRALSSMFGTAEANPSHFTEPRSSDDAAMFDPEGAADSGKKQMHLRYTCIRTS